MWFTRARTRRLTILTVGALLCLGGVAFAQRFFFGGEEGRDVRIRNGSYDGRFTFTRLKYTTAPGGYWYQGLPSWAHGYPLSEDNLIRIMNEITRSTSFRWTTRICRSIRSRTSPRPAGGR